MTNNTKAFSQALIAASAVVIFIFSLFFIAEMIVDYQERMVIVNASHYCVWGSDEACVDLIILDELYESDDSNEILNMDKSYSSLQ